MERTFQCASSWYYSSAMERTFQCALCGSTRTNSRRSTGLPAGLQPRHPHLPANPFVHVNVQSWPCTTTAMNPSLTVCASGLMPMAVLSLLKDARGALTLQVCTNLLKFQLRGPLHRQPATAALLRIQSKRLRSLQ